MPSIGFSTGALARGDVRHGLDMLLGTTACAVELSALRQNELSPLMAILDALDLDQFTYVSVHAPSALAPEYENTAIELLARIHDRGPQARHNCSPGRQAEEEDCLPLRAAGPKQR